MGDIEKELQMRALLKERKQLKEQREAAAAAAAASTAALESSNAADLTSKFSQTVSKVEQAFKAQTVGLKTRDEFQKTREQLEMDERLSRMAAEAAADAKATKRRAAKKKKRAQMTKLSFSDDIDDIFDGNKNDGDEDDNNDNDGDKKRKRKRKAAAGGGNNNDDYDDDVIKDASSTTTTTSSSSSSSITSNLKNPFVDTSFLPDRAREEREEQLRRELAEQWRQEQERIKKEPIEITYSYWDGFGHRSSIQVLKGQTIKSFLAAVQKEWPQLRGATVDALMYVKEDVIIPHHYTFYDLIVTKARGKSGPLFHFDVHDDVRLVADVRVEKDESHAGKVMERVWYEKNKHIFPANRWEVYDPTKFSEKSNKYTIR